MKPQILSGSAVFVFPGCGGGVAAPVFSCCLWSHGCSGRRVACHVGPGCLLGLAAVWPACLLGLAAVCAGGRRPAREIATREPDGSEWSISRPALALPPPSGTAARPTNPFGALHTSGAWCAADMWFGASPRSPARPRHRPSISHVIPLRLVQTLNLYRWNCNVFGVSRKMTAINYVRNVGGGGVVAAHGCRCCPWVSQSGPAAPSGCHRGLVCLVFGVLWCVLLQTSSIQGVFRVDFCPVVTNVVNPRAFSLKMAVFGLRLTTFVTGVLAR